MKRQLRGLLEEVRLPPEARTERNRDRLGLLYDDPGPMTVVHAGLDWLSIAQDRSTSKDGGVARHFSLVTGWAPSYPETTGYIVPTFLDCAESLGRPELRARAIRMLDWLVAIQLPDGAFQGGMINQVPVVPVTFNTGQILLGLAAGARQVGAQYHGPMARAADWLVETQGSDGSWRGNPTPFAAPGDKVYETHVAWGLVEAARVAPGSRYLESAQRNSRWALRSQRPNGWFEHCCLSDPSQPLTHTLGYVLRGLIEVGFATRDHELLAGAGRTAEGLLSTVRPDGSIPGRLKPDWSPGVSWICLTGAVQIATCWFLLYREFGDPRFLHAGKRVNRFVRRTVAIQGSPDIRGGVKGSYPVEGPYGRYQYLNWACKFLVDSCLIENEIDNSGR